MKMLMPGELAKYIDHALLKPDMTDEELIAGLKTAIGCEVYSVCVRGCDIIAAKEILAGSGVKLGTVIGFPHGSQAPGIKAAEIAYALSHGVTEVDCVLSVGKLKAGDENYILSELKAMTNAAHSGGALIKIIFENCLLTNAEIVTACRLAAEAGVDFIKTSTGFSTGGARVADVRLMRENTPPSIKIKASGGIRDLNACQAMIEAGADRIGASATKAILEEAAKASEQNI